MNRPGSVPVNRRAAWREPGLRLLFAAVLIAVAALSSVAYFADRVERALALQGAALMAADLVVEQGAPIPAEWLAHAGSLGLAHARTVTFPSVVLANEQPLLVQAKAVEPGYPLRGRLQVDTPGGPVERAPAEGEAWLEGRLRDRLGVVIGQHEVQLGEVRLRAAGLLVDEPDRGGNLFQLAPRLMLNYADVERSGLLGPGSRVKHRLLLAGDAAAVAAMRGWLEQRLPPGSELADLENARPELRTALERARRFLSLAALCASLLSGVAMLLASRRYVDRALDGAAVLRTLGMGARAVLAWHLKQLFAVVLIATLGGSLLGLGGMAGLEGVWPILLPMLIYMLGHGIHQPCGQAGAVGPFPKAAGAASAMSGFVMMVVAFAMGQWLGASMDGTSLPMIHGVWFWSVATAAVAWGLVGRVPRQA